MCFERSVTYRKIRDVELRFPTDPSLQVSHQVRVIFYKLIVRRFFNFCFLNLVGPSIEFFERQNLELTSIVKSIIHPRSRI